MHKLAEHWERLRRVARAGHHLPHRLLQMKHLVLQLLVVGLELVPFFADMSELLSHHPQLLLLVGELALQVSNDLLLVVVLV